MPVIEFVLVASDFMGEWLNTPRGWKWRSFTKVTLPIAIYRNSSYGELVASVKQSGDLDYASSNMVISYLMHLREKVNPMIINNDARVSLYMMDVDADGFRPILRINVVDRSFKGLMNSSSSPPRCQTVDNDLNDYKSDGDHPMNMEDDCVHIEEVSLDSQDVEEDCRTGSQPDGKGPSICEIQRIVFKELHCHGSYWMCWKGSVIAKNIIRGTPEHGYAWLLIFSHMVELLNPGSFYSIMVIAVNGTHLYGKYEGVLLSAVAQDTENHIFPIAFCVLYKENGASWTSFFQKLKSIVKDEPDLCVISNRHVSIGNAFSRVYSLAYHGLCMRHLAENLCVNQHYGERLYLFYATAKTYSLDRFSENFEELKYNFPEAAHVLENVLGFEK
ncbi:hypothetical protein CQW23_12680 [Capsicum baccatum]|uniref:MULE transposase domain-containing protein n=1 Tax=Capsicum baccatum TaxID=33114 RepID=A0A2G2WTE3_CAPBA|nr:hypothetical protein CQW23_12680 [Capsicum baccatum]